MATKQGSKPAAAADQELDPAFQWQEHATNYVLRLDLSGFKKEDFRVQVDGAGRLTVRGQRQADGKNVRFHKVFQLPSTANLDEISGRFEANVLILTVPKRPATAPTTIDEIKKPQEEQQDTKSPMPKEEDAKPKDGEAKKTTDTKPPKEEDELKKALDEASKKQQQEQEEAKRRKQEEEEEAKRRKQEEEEEAKRRKQEEAKRLKQEEEEEAKRLKQEEEEEAKRRKQEQEQKPTPAVRKEEVMKPNAEAAARPTEKAFDRESLAERVRRYGEEVRAKAAAAAEEAEREKKTLCGRWKERVVDELEQLADLKWADGLVEAARKNKEVIAVAVAAFSLGFFVSHKLLSRK